MTDKAIQELKDAIQIDPAYADAYLNLGVAYASIGEEGKAMAALHKAIQFKPDDSESHYNLGLLYSNRGLGYLVSMIVEKASLVIAEFGPPVGGQSLGSCR
jgi:Tfp pilus assembly protein PilF